MNGSYGFNAGELDEASFDDSFEDAFDGELEEARRAARPGARPVPTAPRGSAYRARPSNTQAPVTQPQLQAALARVGQQINTNSAAIKTVDGRVRTVASEQDRLSATQRRETAERKKELETVRKDLQSTRELSAVLPLLTSLTDNPAIAAFAPLLLLGGDLSGSNGNGGSGGGLLGGGGAGLGGIGGIVALLAISGSFTK